MVDSWITASAASLMRREIARDPGPAGRARPANTNCRRRRCPCNWHWARAARASTTPPSSARLDHDADVPREREFAGDATLQVIPAEVRLGSHGTGTRSILRQAPARPAERPTASRNPAACRCADRRRPASTHRRGAAWRRDPLVDARAGVPPLACEHRAGDLALQLVQIVAQRVPRATACQWPSAGRLSICSLIQVRPMRSPRSKYALAA